MEGKLTMTKSSNDFLAKIKDTTSVFWTNPYKMITLKALKELELSYEDILDADERLKRFAPLISELFPETCDGIIESPVVHATKMKKQLENNYGTAVNGDIYLKCDNYLKIAGSIKARGGIY